MRGGKCVRDPKKGKQGKCEGGSMKGGKCVRDHIRDKRKKAICGTPYWRRRKRVGDPRRDRGNKGNKGNRHRCFGRNCRGRDTGRGRGGKRGGFGGRGRGDGRRAGFGGRHGGAFEDDKDNYIYYIYLNFINNSFIYNPNIMTFSLINQISNFEVISSKCEIFFKTWYRYFKCSYR